MEFSKRILIASWCVTLAMTAVVITGSFLCLEMDAVGTLTALSWGELTAVHAFYMWKAKNENRIKLTRSMVKEWADEYGFESVTALADIVLKGD